MKKILAIVFSTLILISVSVNYCNASTSYSLKTFDSFKSANLFVASNDIGGYFYGFESQNVQIATIFPEFNLVKSDIGADITAICLNGNFTYTLSSINETKYKISQINNKTGEVKNYNYSLSVYYDINQLSVNGGKYFMIKSDGVYSYVASAPLGKTDEITYKFGEHNVNRLITNNGKTYVLLDNYELYRVSNGESYYVTDVGSDCKLYDAGANTLLSSSGNIYFLSDGSSIKAKSNKAYLSNVTNDSYFYVSGNTVFKTKLNSYDCMEKEVPSNPRYLIAYKDKIAVVTDNCKCEVFSDSDFISRNMLNSDSEISSYSAYGRSVNSEYKIIGNEISGIKSGTTVSEFKKCFSANAVIKSTDGKTVTSGKIKTGQTLSLDGKRYELSVLGDVTGEGNVKSNDVRCISEYLLGSKELIGIYKISADYNGDGNVDNKDIVLISRTAKS